MQDNTNNTSNKKQYFDIKAAPKPDPTSRPVVNNVPIQEDPMVSATTAGVEAKVASVSEQPNVPISESDTKIDNPEPTNVTTEDESKQTQQPVSTTPTAVQEHLAQSSPQPNITQNTTPDVSQHTVSINKKPPIKKIIGVIIIVVLLVTAAVIYKSKMGK